jgi:hypothetical protein
MSDLRDAAELALTALENTCPNNWTSVKENLRKALAQPEQGPTCPECKAAVLYECVACSSNNYPPKPEQEPVAWMVTYGGLTHVEYTLPSKVVDTHYQPLYTTPPAAQRPWQGLTDEDVNRESAPIAQQMKLAFHAGMYVAQKILQERNT